MKAKVRVIDELRDAAYRVYMAVPENRHRMIEYKNGCIYLEDLEDGGAISRYQRSMTEAFEALLCTNYRILYGKSCNRGEWMVDLLGDHPACRRGIKEGDPLQEWFGTWKIERRNIERIIRCMFREILPRFYDVKHGTALNTKPCTIYKTRRDYVYNN